MAVETPPPELGAPCPDFRLPAVDGKTLRARRLRRRPVLVVMFICNHCPYVKAVEDRLIRLAREFEAARRAARRRLLERRRTLSRRRLRQAGRALAREGLRLPVPPRRGAGRGARVRRRVHARHLRLRPRPRGSPTAGASTIRGRTRARSRGASSPRRWRRWWREAPVARAAAVDGVLDQMAKHVSKTDGEARPRRARARRGPQGALARLPRAQGAEDHPAARGDRRRVPAHVGARRARGPAVVARGASTRGVGLATVYRTVKLLEEAGIAAARHFGPGQTLYEVAEGRAHHDHLICDSCGFITEFENDEIEAAAGQRRPPARLQRAPPSPRAVRPVREGPGDPRRALPRRGERPPRAIVNKTRID